MALFQNKYRISPARLESWDYGSNATYFVTICTSEKIHDFGRVVNGKIQLSELGNVANNCWREIPLHFPFVELDEYVIMPNHIHGIIIINKPHQPNVEPQDFAAPPNTGPDNASPTQVEPQDFAALDNTRSDNASPTRAEPQNLAALHEWQTNKFAPQTRNLGSIIRGFKIGVAKYETQHNIQFKWQPRFHDHIIRNTQSFFLIRQYIVNNPQSWHDDRYYTAPTTS